MLCYPLLADPVTVNITHTIGSWTFWPTAWSQFRTVLIETMGPVAEWSCWWKKVTFIFRCLRTVSFKYRFSLGLVSRLWPCPGSCFVLHFHSPRNGSRYLKSHFVQLQWLPLFRFVPDPLITDQHLFKLVNHINVFVDIYLTHCTHLNSKNADHYFKLCLLLIWKSNVIRWH